LSNRGEERAKLSAGGHAEWKVTESTNEKWHKNLFENHAGLRRISTGLCAAPHDFQTNFHVIFMFFRI